MAKWAYGKGKGIKAMHKSNAQRVFNVFNIIFMVLIAVITLYPFWYTVVMSFSTVAEAGKPGLHLYPHSVTISAYAKTFANEQIFIGFKNTLFKTVFGTFFGVLFTSAMAYALAHKDMPCKRLFSFLVTMILIFDVGTVPKYMVINKLKLIDNYLVYILPGLVVAYNVIILKSNFKALPQSLIESAKVDGANEVITFFKIILPISKAAIATITLWVAVGNWNGWLDGLLYITDNKKQILQIFLQRIIANNVTDAANWMDSESNSVTPETIKSAAIVITMLPILCVYPFVQKYFVKGVTLGAVKG